MAEATETATNQTEAAAATETAAATLLSSTDAAATTEQTGETQTETAKPAEGAKPAETAKPEGAPETYDFKAPEGKEYDSAVLTSFSDAAKAANLTQDAAQKLLESMAPTLATRQQEQVKAIQTGWADASKTDKEFGGEKLQENLAVAQKALAAYSTPEFRKLLDNTGLGNHPEVIRAFVKIGKGMNEDGFVAGRGGAPTATTTAALLYDKTPSK
jgi:hypothetical protein